MRRRIRLGALSAVALLLLWFSLTRGDDRGSSVAVAVQPDDGPEPRQARAATPAEAKPTRSVPQRMKPVTLSFGRPNPVVDRVWVDKLEVCRGEENFAHVDVHTVDSSDAALKISLAGTGFFGSGSTGGKLPFRLLAPTNAEDMPRVLIFGARGTHATEQLPFVKVKDCDAEPFLRIEARRVPEQGPDAFELEAGAPEDVTLSNVRWTFGDSHSATSPAPKVAHDYSNRRQLTAYSSFLITVTATDDRGRTLRGSRTIEFVNQEYWKNLRGT
jgi:hypothetical protein